MVKTTDSCSSCLSLGCDSGVREDVSIPFLAVACFGRG